MCNEIITKSFIQVPILLTWINFKTSMDQLLHPLSSVGEITYISQNFNRETEVLKDARTKMVLGTR